VLHAQHEKARRGGHRAIGLATVRSSEADVAQAAQAEQALVGAAPNRPIGQAPEQGRSKAIDVEDPAYEARIEGAKVPQAAPTEPFAGAQWDMRMIGATPEKAHARQQGAGVQVGIIDTGIEGSHPDIAPNFNAELSRNLTFDIPKAPNGEEVDGPCEAEAATTGPGSRARRWPRRTRPASSP
jgi:subtilisin family serine protease